MKKVIFAASLLALSATSAMAQTTRVVDSSGGGDATTIAAALAASVSGDTISVVNSGSPYTEALDISIPITISGADANDPPLILVDAGGGVTSAGFPSSTDGIIIEVDGAVTMENLILIPANNTITDGIRGSSTTAGTLDLTINNVHMSANDGSDAPVVPFSADDYISLPIALDTSGGAFGFDDTFYVTGTSASGIGNDSTINADLTDLRIFATEGDDAMVLYHGTGGSTSLSGVVINGSPDDGTQFGTILGAPPASITGTLTGTGDINNPSIVVTNTGDGLFIFESGDVDLDHAISVNNGGAATQAGIFLQTSDLNSAVITNSLFANNTRFGIITAGVNDTFTLSISDSTIFANGTDANNGDANISLDGGTLATTNITDTIIAGSGGVGIDSAGEGTDTIVVRNTVVATSGANALATDIDPGAGSVDTDGTVLSIDPQFSNTVISPVSDTSFIVTNPALAGAAQNGTDDLDGFAELLFSSAKDWTVYQ